MIFEELHSHYIQLPDQLKLLDRLYPYEISGNIFIGIVCVTARSTRRKEPLR